MTAVEPNIVQQDGQMTCYACAESGYNSCYSRQMNQPGGYDVCSDCKRGGNIMCVKTCQNHRVCDRTCSKCKLSGYTSCHSLCENRMLAVNGEMDRGTWTGRLDFILSCIGYAVGLGNIWRFPYLCFRNGGGAFLIPYTIFLFLAGLPLFFFELSFGQFASLGPIAIWKVAPLFRGVGYAMVLISAMVCIYYNIIIMWAIYYMLVSMVSLDDILPWQTCGNPWNTPKCYAINQTAIAEMTEPEKVEEKMLRMNETCVDQKLALYGMDKINITRAFLVDNFTDCSLGKLYHTPSDEYWHNHVLRIDEANGIGDLGPVSLKLTIFLLLAWILIFFCLRKGVKSSGKVVYFTATFPYFVLIVLLVRGVTLEGSYKGIEFYIFPVWEELLKPAVWGDAAAQIFYSLGPAFGGLLTMSSYNRFNNNCMRDAIIVALINCFTSVFAGFVIFSMLGFIATNLEINVRDVAVDGAGLVFIVYPEGIGQMPVAPLWAFLFFFMLLTLGLDSQFAMMETIISAISDVFPNFLRRHKAAFTLFCCSVGFALGIPMVTSGGIYVLTILNDYSAGFSLMVVSLCELIAINYVYGFKRFRQDIKMMLGFDVNIYFTACWLVITPIILIFIIILSALRSAGSAYNGEVFPDWAQGVGWVTTAIPILAIVVIGIIELIRAGSIKKAITPSADWGPALDENRKHPYKPLAQAYGYANQGYMDVNSDTNRHGDIKLNEIKTHM